MNGEPFPTLSHPPQGGIIRFGKDLLTDVYICSSILINFHGNKKTISYHYPGSMTEARPLKPPVSSQQ